MTYHLTLVASPDAGVSTELVERLARRLPEPVSLTGRRWLDERRALDLDLKGATGTGVEGLRAILREILDPEPLDWCLAPARDRRKRLLVADMESTIIENELLPELAALAGHGETVAALTGEAMGGRLEFDASLDRRVALLAGLPANSISRVARNIRYTDGARALVGTMRKAGARAALVSSGFRCFAEIVARELGFDDYHANELEVVGSELTGKVPRPILNGESKRAILEELASRWGVAPRATAALGDGANDLAMLAVAGLGAAFHASPAVAARAPVRIDHGDLTTLLYFQGYHREEIAF